MSRLQDSGPYSEIVMRAVKQVTTGERHPDGPGWNALGIDAQFLEHAARHAVDDDDALTLKRDAVRARVGTLLRGGPDPRILDATPADMRRETGRRFAEDRLALMQARRTFVDRGPAIRPLFIQVLRHAGLDAAVACMIAVAGRWQTSIPVRHGIASLVPLDSDRNGDLPEGSILGEMRIGVPLAATIRFTTTTDMRLWIVTPPMPQTITTRLAGMTLDAVVAHPALPPKARITETGRLGDVSADLDRPDDVVIHFEWPELARTWRGCDPNAFGPIGGV